MFHYSHQVQLKNLNLLNEIVLAGNYLMQFLIINHSIYNLPWV